MGDIYRHLQVKSVERLEHFRFNVYNFYFFRNREGRSLVFFMSPQILSPPIIVPFILAMEIVLFRGRRYFFQYKEQTVGILALHEKSEALYVSILGVAPERRRHGIGTYMLNYASNMAKHLDKKWLEPSVSKMNPPALNLYKKLGFTMKKEKRWSYTLRKKIEFDKHSP